MELAEGKENTELLNVKEDVERKSFGEAQDSTIGLCECVRQGHTGRKEHRAFHKDFVA
jgi:hypothetical protein